MKILDMTQLARPYARAAFEYALEHKQLSQWSEDLKVLGKIIDNPEMQRILKNPEYSTKQISDFFIDLINKNLINKRIENFIKILVENRRLLIIPKIVKLFEEFSAEKEKILHVQVDSVIQLSEDFKNNLIETLNKKLRREIIIHSHLNPQLIGGMIIRAGDLVIDGSVRGQFERMRGAVLCK